MDVECAGLIAGKPCSHRVWGGWQNLCTTTDLPVGASLLAMAGWQAILMLDVPASSRAGSLPQGNCGVAGAWVRRRSTVGASWQATLMLDVPASSRAGSLLQGNCGVAGAWVRRRSTVGASLLAMAV
ncbi:hypothetical protein DKY63_09945 [Pseudomonas putida]|uniref:Uncharacterized protein n=1 Tax=Pseudomonas putida TaxID=303 RepID=A0A2Z4RHH6_PSEPU|nr:hypothetical protein DKY63_09945 [Pseudomonas putida]